MRICLLYDSLEPYRIGGAERWYHSLAERLGRAGHEVTYVTMRQWAQGEAGEHPNAKVAAVGPRMENYAPGGARTILPPLLFGWGVFLHLLRHGRRYDVVHTCSFPYFSVLAAALAMPFGRYRLTVDWFEYWSGSYWRRYLGRAGWIGIAVQRLCAMAPQRAFCFSRTMSARLRESGINGQVESLTGAYAGDAAPAEPRAAEPLVVFAGRHIPEKRVPLVVEAIKLARREIPDLKGIIFGCGPDFDKAFEAAKDADYISMPGFVHKSVLKDAMARAACLLHPSEREGYGLVVIEAAALGTPAVLAAGPDNAAAELVEEGINGFVVAEPTAEALAGAVVAAWRAGPDLRASTASWYRRNAARLSIDGSLDRVASSYIAPPRGVRRGWTRGKTLAPAAGVHPTAPAS